jgi:predicted dehydrogenase
VILGLGNIAWKFGRDQKSHSSFSHRDALDQCEQTMLVGGYAPSNREVADFSNATGVKGYTDLAQMLEVEQPDLVSICSPEAVHAAQLKICLDHKISMVWLEKPAATLVSDVVKLEEARTAMASHSRVLVNFQRRYVEAYQKMAQLIVTEELGKPLVVEVHYSRGLVINGAHMVDTLFHLFPKAEYQLLWVERGEGLNNPDFILRLDNQLLVHVSGIDSAFHNIDVSVTCEQGRLSILHGGMTLRVERVAENDRFPGYYRLYDQEPDLLGRTGFEYAMDNALQDLLDAHQQQRDPVSNLATAIQGEALVEEVLRRSLL